MKNYQTPEIEIVALNTDIITTSATGTETTPQPENGGIWDLEIG